MLELTGATLRAGHDRRRRRRPARRSRSGCATRASSGLLGVAIAARPAGRDPHRARLRRARSADDGLDVTVPHFRRNDVTREADLIEEVARIDGVDKLPGDAAHAPRRARRAHAPSSACAAAPRTRSSAAACTRSSAGASPTRRRSTACACPGDQPAARRRRAREPDERATQSICARRSSARCSTPRRHNAAPAARRDLALFESGRRSYREQHAATATATAPARRRAPRARRAPRRAPAPAELGDPEPPRADFFAVKGYVGAVARRAARRLGRRARDRAVPAPGPQRADPRRRERAPSAGSASSTRSSRARGTSTRRGRRVRGRPRHGVVRHADAVPTYRDLTSFPALRQDLAVVVSDDVPAAAVVAVVRRAGGDAARGRRASSTSTAARRWGRGARRSRSRLQFRAPDRTLDRRGRRAAARRDRRRAARRARGRAPCLSVLVAGASGYTGALAARLLDRHPRFDLVAVTSRSDAGRRLDDLYPHHRVPLTLEELDLDRHGDVDAAIVAYPHGAVGAGRRRAARPRRAGRRPQRRLPPARPSPTYEHWYVEHPHPELHRATPSTACPSATASRSRDADLVANPGCFPTATILALAPLAPATSPTSSSTPRPASRAPGARRRETTHFVAADENVTPYGVGAHRHMPEIDQELAARGRAGDLASPSRRTCCRSTRASSSPAT